MITINSVSALHISMYLCSFRQQETMTMQIGTGQEWGKGNSKGKDKDWAQGRGKKHDKDKTQGKRTG